MRSKPIEFSMRVPFVSTVDRGQILDCATVVSAHHFCWAAA